MSDLTAANCGCNDSCGCGCTNNNLFGGNNCIWIILLLLLCGNGCGDSNCGCGNSCGCGSNNGIGLLGGGCGNSSCSWLIWILLISCFCGGGNSCC